MVIHGAARSGDRRSRRLRGHRPAIRRPVLGIFRVHGLALIMSGRRSLIKGYFWRYAGRGRGHVFGLSRGQLDPLALMLSADPLPRSEQRA